MIPPATIAVRAAVASSPVRTGVSVSSNSWPVNRPVVLLSLIASFAPASPSSRGGLSSNDIVCPCFRPPQVADTEARRIRARGAERRRQRGASRHCDQCSPVEPAMPRRHLTFPNSGQDGELRTAIQERQRATIAGNPARGEIMAIRSQRGVRQHRPAKEPVMQLVDLILLACSSDQRVRVPCVPHRVRVPQDRCEVAR